MTKQEVIKAFKIHFPGQKITTKKQMLSDLEEGVTGWPWFPFSKRTIIQEAPFSYYNSLTETEKASKDIRKWLITFQTLGAVADLETETVSIALNLKTKWIKN